MSLADARQLVDEHTKGLQSTGRCLLLDKAVEQAIAESRKVPAGAKRSWGVALAAIEDEIWTVVKTVSTHISSVRQITEN